MSAEIDHLRNMIDNTNDGNASWIALVLDRFGKEIASVLCAPGKVLGHIVRGVSSLFKK